MENEQNEQILSEIWEIDQNDWNEQISMKLQISRKSQK